MAENMLEIGPPNSKRPKLNSPALSSSDGPGKAPLSESDTVVSKVALDLSCDVKLSKSGVSDHLLSATLNQSYIIVNHPTI